MTVAVREEIVVPEGAEISYAPTGVMNGIKLADGTVIKMWIAYEIEDKEGNYTEMDTMMLNEMGIYNDGDLERYVAKI